MRSIAGDGDVLFGHHDGHRRGDGGDDGAGAAGGFTAGDEGTLGDAAPSPSSRRGRGRDAGAAVNDFGGARGRSGAPPTCPFPGIGADRGGARAGAGPLLSEGGARYCDHQKIRAKRIIRPLT